MKNTRLPFSCVRTPFRLLISRATAERSIAFARRFALAALLALFPVLHLGWDARSFAGSRLSISAQPANETVNVGQSATFTVAASGRGSISYQWFENGAQISGANSSSYTTPPTSSSDNGAQFDVVVHNKYGSVTSSMATLTVISSVVPPGITTEPINQTVTAGQVATFTVAANGTAPLAFQWQKNGANISGATSSNYTTPVTTTADNGATFDAVVSNAAGSVTSTTATLTVNSAPAPAIQLSSTALNFSNDIVNTSASLSLIITNTGTATLSISQINVTGAAFSLSGVSMPLNVSAGQKTTVSVVFSPTSTGTATGSLSVVSNAPTSPSSVTLSGSAVAATYTLGVSPTSLSFGDVTTGTSSAAQSVTVTNTGNSSVTISSIAVSGTGYSMSGGGSNVTLTPSQTLSVSVAFDPTSAGSVNGSISVASNATGSPATVTLSGTGMAQSSVALAWDASASTVAGYNVYRTTISGSAYVKVNSLLLSGMTYSDPGVKSGTTYYYVVTAVDSGGDESTYSNQVSAAIP